MGTVHEGRPDPGAATTPTEFLQALHELRAWAGQPSLRTLTALAGTVPGQPPADVLPVSTLSDNLAGKRLPNLPRLSFVVAFVGACLQTRGHHDEKEIAAETDRWSQAWQAMSATGTGQPPDQPTQADPQPAPEPLVADLSPAPARSDPYQRHKRRAAGLLPAITGFLGVTIGALIVWLAMPTTPANINRPPSSLPPAAMPGVGGSTSPSSGRPSATLPTRQPAQTENTPMPASQPRPTAQAQTAPTRPAPAPSARTRSTPAKFTPWPYQSTFTQWPVPTP